MIFSPLDGEAKRVSPAPPNVVVWPHSAEPLRRGSFTTHAAAAEGGGNFFWGNSISCQQHPAVRKLRDADVVDGGENAHAGESRTRRGRRNEDAVDGGDGESLTAVTAVTAPAVSVEAYGRSRRAPDASVMKSGTFLLGALRNDRNADGMLAALHGQHIKGKLRTDHLPQIPSGPLTRDKAELETKQRSSDSGAAPDAVRPISRYALRVSGYPASSGGTSIGTIKPIASRPQRQPMQRSVMPARPSATHYQETISKLELSAVGINAQQGAKAALDSCRVPLDLSSLKGEEDGLRKINRSTRGLYSQRGEPAEQEAWRSGNARAGDNGSGELVVCNSQKVEETDLVFMSQFESGNLLSAQRVGPEEYDLQLQVDNATSGHTQWFYFCVSNTFPGVQYRLNIINFAKPHSLYTRGQQPLFFSLLSSKKENAGWRRIGRDIRYFRNGRKRNGKTLFTLSFLVEFAYAKDKCLFAHCYPYTYTELQDYINKMLHQPFSRNLLTSHHLCTTLGGNVCPVLTITSPQGSEEEIKARKVIFVSSRVHPGESNSSWIMKGLLDFLLGQSVEAELLRFRFIFKILPMLNPDGVINGHYRCNLAGYDLNRHWHDPDRNVHPTIFHAKDLLRNLQRDQEVVMFCDIHGHSVKHNLFLYGCPKAKPESETAMMQPDGEPLFHDFPNVLNFASSFFSMPDSRFVIEKIKEHTGRVVAWRELGIANSFTLEASLCGSGDGKSQCTAQFTCDDFEAMGRSFGVSLALASSESLFQSVRDDPELLRNMLLSHTDSEEAWGSRGETHDSANQTQPSTARVRAVATPHEDTSAPNIAEFRSSPPHAPPGPPVTSLAVSATAEAGQNTTYRQASAIMRFRRRVAAVNNNDKTGPWLRSESHPSEATPMRDPMDNALCGAHIAPTLRLQPSQHAVSRQREAESVPKEIPPSTSLATDGEDESSSDDERNVDDDAAGNPPDIGNFMADCQEVKRKVQYWGVMQQKKRQSLEARMRDLRLMSTMRKPDRLHEPSGGANGGDGAGLAEALPSGETATHRGPGVGEVCVRVTTETDRGRETEAETHRGWPHRGPGVCEICVRDKQGELSQLFSNLRGGAQTFRDIQSLSVGSCMMQMSLSPKGRAVHEHGQHRHEMERNARSWAHAGRFQGMDTAQAHAGENMVTHTSYPSGSSLGGGTGVAEFSPLARRQRCTTQRLQEKNATQTQTPSSRGGYQPTGGGFGAHKPVGPQCKFLPIMLGSLRGADSSSSES